jgi:secondary thiamine-phosphate synthase enzyme
MVSLETEGGFDVRNITELFKEFVESSGVAEGVGIVCYQHATGSVIIAEHEAGIVADLEDMLEKTAPKERTYLHHRREVDRNGHAHVRSAFMGTSVSVPIYKGTLHMGTYQDILVIDMQTERNPRELVFQAIGE